MVSNSAAMVLPRLLGVWLSQVCSNPSVPGCWATINSLAGKRRGEEDERDLWSTARRIIVQSRAWFVLIENVRGMLTSGGAERVWRDLHRLGFQVEGGLFTAAVYT